MEAAGSLAPAYPKVFSGRMVPRLGEELQSGKADSLAKGLNFWYWGETEGLCHMVLLIEEFLAHVLCCLYCVWGSQVACTAGAAQSQTGQDALDLAWASLFVLLHSSLSTARGGAGSHPNTPLSCISSLEREEESSRDLHSLQQRCLQALAAVSTHTSIVRETVPVLLQHLRNVQKGNTAGGRQLCAAPLLRR